tara:strand:+ start:588 stop:1358 length:771 start_codon:yes stop_codon:yes gene_type:complete
MEEKEKEKVKETKKWAYKDRHYYLLNNQSPLSYTIPSKHTRRYPLVWFDPEKGYERELRYATNQQSVFVDEQKGQVTLKHVVFSDGFLSVPKEKRNLQEFLELHPHKGKIFQEHDEVKVAEIQTEDLELQVISMNAALQMDIDFMEAIMRTELGNKVSKMSSKELKRDTLLFARRNPRLFIDLAQDEDLQTRNIGIIAAERGIIKLSSDQRTFKWGSNGRKLMNIPFDENPYSALAAWFKTDEGVEVFKTIEKKLK